MSQMHRELVVAVEAARVAGRLLGDTFGSDHQVFHKGPADLVTEMDRRAEEAIFDILSFRQLTKFNRYNLV